MNNRLKTMRKVTHKTQKEIADFIGITPSDYSYWENGKVRIDDASWAKLADYYNVSVDFLSGRKYYTTCHVSMWSKDHQEDYLNADEYLKKYLEYLHGEIRFEDKEETPIELSDDALKIALFGGDTEVSDEMWDEVMSYAEYIKQKYGKN